MYIVEIFYTYDGEKNTATEFRNPKDTREVFMGRVLARIESLTLAGAVITGIDMPSDLLRHALA